MSLTFEPGQRSRSQRDITYQHKSAIIHFMQRKVVEGQT